MAGLVSIRFTFAQFGIETKPRPLLRARAFLISRARRGLFGKHEKESKMIREFIAALALAVIVCAILFIA